MAKGKKYNSLSVLKTFVLSDSLTFTQYFFVKKHKRLFVTGGQHRRIADALNDVFTGKVKRLIINIPPRYSKTEMIKSFMAQGLAINPASLFLILSYSDSLALSSSLAVREIVNMPEYQGLFGVQVKKNVDSKRRWDTTSGGGIYATSTLGQVTGFGAGAMDLTEDEQKAEEDYTNALLQATANAEFAGAIVIDDPIKPEDALSDLVRDKVNARFETTIRSRTNSRNTPIIIIMQRLALNDLSGYLMETEKDVWTVLSLPALIEDEKGERALFPHKHTVEELKKLRDIDPFTFDTQYQQNPIPKEGLMYSRGFKTYEYFQLPSSAKAISKNYTDTADDGTDYLCSVNYIETEFGMFVRDVLYTDQPMEFTEPQTAKMMNADGVEFAKIESNNGGKGFARNVERELRLMKNTSTTIDWFFQGKNKAARIFTHSNEVQNLVYMPSDWQHRWPRFYKDVTTYKKTGKNAHDDGPDVLTGMAEDFGQDGIADVLADIAEALPY